MAKKTTSKKAKPTATFNVGDEVEILYFGHGKVVELRGPLGPNGAQVYRVRYRTWPTAGYMEVLGDQIRLEKADKKPKAAKGKKPADADSPGVEAEVGG
jgi:hypothetical protein